MIDEVVSALVAAMDASKDLIPQKTGNLRYNSLRVQILGSNHIRLVINEEIAPYAPFTNEPWVSPKWREAKNPNEGWWDRYIAKVLGILAEKLGGTLKND